MATSADIEGVSDVMRKDVDRGINILKAGGCKAVYIFGAVAEGSNSLRSDIDFAVKGCPANMFYKLQGKLLLELTRSADLIDLDADTDLASYLESESDLIHVG